jgi:cation:H+ antiporter
MDILKILLGLGLATYGAKFLINGGASIARRFSISDLVIGSTIVAFGTSMPELSVNVQSALAGNTGLAMGNILGSNIFNICLIIGIADLIHPMRIVPSAVHKDFPMCLVAAIAVGVCGNELYFNGIDYHKLTPSNGIVFLLFFSIFAYYTYREAAAGVPVTSAADPIPPPKTHDTSNSSEASTSKAVIYIILGLVALTYGGDFIVDGASGVAKRFGLSDRVVGLLIVGPGTSFPELITSIVAALNKKTDIVIGSVLGSNIINIFFTLGVTSLIMPVPLDLALNNAVLFNIAVTLLLMIVAFLKRGKPIGRFIGSLLCLSYASYIIVSLGMP